FAHLAKEAALPGWEGDVEAFRRYNRMRNALVHRGDPDVRLHVNVGEDELHSLEDLVERYISRMLFGDAMVYSSRWRPNTSPADGKGQDPAREGDEGTIAS